MTFTRTVLASVALAAALSLAPAAIAQTPAPSAAQAPPPDALTDPSMKGKEVVAFISLKPGDKVADIVAGRFVRILSQTVGPKGQVIAYEPDEIVKAHPEVMGMMSGFKGDPAYANVKVATAPINKPGLPTGLDAVFIRQNYHDLHDKFMGPADVAAFNKAVFASLKPGGVYVVLDHAAAAGTGLKDTDTIHRIDVASVKSEVQAAGFKLDSESKILANPADDHTKMVFDPSVRGKTDQFLLKFRKPK
ncbi:MAG: methyltransferase [Alphaproteobacteria bacterium]